MSAEEEPRVPLPAGTNKDRYDEFKGRIVQGEIVDPSIGQTDSQVFHDSKGTVNEYNDGPMPDAWLDEFTDKDGRTLRAFMAELEKRFGIEEARRRLGLKVADPLQVAESRSYQARLCSYIQHLKNVEKMKSGSKEWRIAICIWQVENTRVSVIRNEAMKMLTELQGDSPKKMDVRSAHVTMQVTPEAQRAGIEQAFLNWRATAGKNLLTEGGDKDA